MKILGLRGRASGGLVAVLIASDTPRYTRKFGPVGSRATLPDSARVPPSATVEATSQTHPACCFFWYLDLKPVDPAAIFDSLLSAIY